MRQLFHVSWRVALLCLPWQTQWILQTGSIGGFPWEQGTLRIYASWMPLAVAAGTGLLLSGKRSSAQQWHSRERLMRILATLFLTGAIVGTSSWTATGMWALEAFLLAAFVFALFRQHVSSQTIGFWFVLALLPHTALGIWQFFVQDIGGASVLGIAEHRPWASGTSVVEHGLYRVLRAYGGFPHPNIFGGWLAAGLALLPFLVRQAAAKYGVLFYVFSGAAFTAALLFTFSRGAWVAAVFGFFFAFAVSLKHASFRADKQSLWLLFAVVAALTAWGAVTQWDHIYARIAATERLEQWSLVSRKTSLIEGWEAWKLRPVTGFGPGAGIVGIQDIRNRLSRPSPAAPEPPHIVPLSMLVDMGILGFVAFILATFIFWNRRKTRFSWHVSGPVLAVFLLLAFTDHYLWTLWPGMALGAVILLLCAADIPPKAPGPLHGKGA
ncbi:O-antigen ligase family protein [Patescibacteria group bacterium]|nr:O-antigen ligase family protein [Patescibacteria group bacterium]MDL1953214.1 O-antigen ligase family protein [Candidatus Uhrbacteria bacterium UHB]RIL00980.1 MAG: hypothetical protein DCC77_00345 [Candidatus Uhrbacteria bacterium]